MNTIVKRHLQVEWVPLDRLKPNADNPNTHPPHQLRTIARSVTRFGFTSPILVDGEFRIIAGHGRYEAAKRLGLETVPIIRLVGLSEVECRALMIADNRIAEKSVWDPLLLKAELQKLVDIQFDMDDIGFDAAELDLCLDHDADGVKSDAADEVELPDRSRPAITQIGDLYRLGEHLLACGDSRDPAVFHRLLAGEMAQMVFADPPYDVPVDGHVMGRGKVRHEEFAMASGEMSAPEFIKFLANSLKQMAENSLDGAIHFICIDWRHFGDLLTAARDVFELKNLCIWCKDNGGMGSLYRSQHELIAVFKNGDAPHINNVELGRKGRNRTNVWRYPGINTFRKGRLDDLRAHPTVKPVRLVADAILDCSTVGGLVLDPFVGSGTTILACEQTQRRAAAIEIDRYYVDTAIERFQKHAGITAIHGGTNLTFEEYREMRLKEDHAS